MTEPRRPATDQRPFRARAADVAGFTHADAVAAFARETAATELAAIALDVDNDTVAAILRDRAAELLPVDSADLTPREWAAELAEAAEEMTADDTAAAAMLAEEAEAEWMTRLAAQTDQEAAAEGWVTADPGHAVALDPDDYAAAARLLLRAP